MVTFKMKGTGMKEPLLYEGIMGQALEKFFAGRTSTGMPP